MTFDSKVFILNTILFFVFMALVACEWAFGWPTNQHLLYLSTAWLVFACVSNLYVWHVESKDEV